MPKLHLKQLGFSYSAFRPFAKRIQKLRETGNFTHLNRNALDKACFAHDAVCSDSKDLAKRAISEKILKDKPYEISRKSKYYDVKEH